MSNRSQQQVYSFFLLLPVIFIYSAGLVRAQEYVLDPDWPNALPDSITWGQVPNVTIDLSGMVYAFHREEPPVLKFNPSGVLVDSWGSEWVSRPHGFRVSHDGTLWATDYHRDTGHTVTQFSTDGRVLLRLGARGFTGTGPNTFNGPTDVAIAANGDIFVADGHWNNRVVKFSDSGRYISEWGKKGSGPGDFNLPHSIVIDKRGRVLVGDRSNHRIQIFTQEGQYLDEWAQFGWPSGLFIDSNDVLYVADYQSKHGVTFGSADTGEIFGYIAGVEPEGVVVDASGNVYASEVTGGEEGPGRIVKKFLRVPAL
jgi:hypothetical protein